MGAFKTTSPSARSEIIADVSPLGFFGARRLTGKKPAAASIRGFSRPFAVH
jgi:hypothetical protein